MWKRVINGKAYFPYIVSTTDAQHNLRTAAGIRCDYELSTKMGDYDLTAKEFIMHKVCYNNYVRVIDLNLKKSDNCETIKGDNGDYNAVKQLIEEVIIGCNKAMSMIVIYETSTHLVNTILTMPTIRKHAQLRGHDTVIRRIHLCFIWKE